jgi:hypothetical protein
VSRASELIQQIVGLLQEDEDLQLEFARAFLTSRTLRRLLHADPELAQTLRSLILTEALLELPEKVEPLLQLPEKVEPLLQLPEKVEPLLQLPERVDALEAAVNELRAVVNRIEPAVIELQKWQRGEVARRKGDDYERSVIQRAGCIFGLSQGGSPRDDAAVRQQILLWLDAAGLLDEEEDPASDPLEADLIWWKGERVALAEISVKVDRHDVRRAKQRAETLRRAGLTVTPVVIGAQWAHRQTPKIAQREGVESVVKGVYSQGVIDFRRYRPS